MSADKGDDQDPQELEGTIDSEAPPPTQDIVASSVESGVVIADRYTLRERIGVGGMGEVWVAKQSEPVKRRVALKLVKTGMDSKAVLARFEQERQALALMDHPNIARVLDGGMTPSGQPFFVMELVNGAPLDKFCDGAKLALRQRLELFVPICQAVQHAHQKGIVHRDLKPANILVTMIDGKPTPKVIDFGVAKAFASGELTEETMTQFGAVVGTLEYMSPEQASFSGDDIDTRADIYSLGVILYELLTGLRPIDQARLKKAALTEMVRIIREEEPSKPSTRLSTDEALPDMAALRQTEPSKLMASLRGELDWVVMKCLEKERDRRYETANGLGRDIQRFLDDEPVEARPASTGYRLQKFLKRNKGPAVAVCLLVVSLLSGIAGTTWGLLEANKQAEIAGEAATAKDLALQAEQIARQDAVQKAEAEKAARQEAEDAQKSAQAGIELIASVFENLDPEEVANRDRTLQELIVEQLDSAIQGLGAGSIGDQRQVADLQLRLGKSLLALDEVEKSLSLLESARQAKEDLLGLHDPTTLASMHHLSRAYQADGQLDKVMPLRQQTYNLRKEHLGEDHQDTLESLVALSEAYSLQGNYTKATELAEDAVVRLEDVLGPVHKTTLAAVFRLLEAYSYDGQMEELQQKSVAMLEQCRQELGPEDMQTLKAQGWVAYTKGNTPEGVKGIEEYVADLSRIFGPNHSMVLEAEQLLASLYSKTQRYAAGIELAEKVLVKRKEKLGAQHPSLISSLSIASQAHYFRRNTEKALPLAKQAFDIAEAVFGLDHPTTQSSLVWYAEQLQESGDWETALPLLQSALEFNKEHRGLDHNATIKTMVYIASCHQKQARFEKAIEISTEWVDIAESKMGVEYYSTTCAFVQILAQSYKSLGDTETAISLVSDYANRCEKEKGIGWGTTQAYLELLAGLYEESGQFDKALERRERLFENSRNDHDRASYGVSMIKSYGRLEESEKAKAIASELLSEIRSAAKSNSAELASGLSKIGGALLVVRAYEEAVEVQRECLKIREQALSEDSWSVSISRFNLGWALLGAGLTEEAEAMLSKGYRGLDDKRMVARARSNHFAINSGRDILQGSLSDIIRLYRSANQVERAGNLEAELNRRLKAWGREPATTSP